MRDVGDKGDGRDCRLRPEHGLTKGPHLPSILLAGSAFHSARDVHSVGANAAHGSRNVVRLQATRQSYKETRESRNRLRCECEIGATTRSTVRAGNGRIDKKLPCTPLGEITQLRGGTQADCPQERSPQTCEEAAVFVGLVTVKLEGVEVGQRGETLGVVGESGSGKTTLGTKEGSAEIQSAAVSRSK